MIKKISIFFAIGLVICTVFLLFVNNKKLKQIIATLVLSAYFAILTIGVFASGATVGNLKLNFTGEWASKEILWSPLPESAWDFFSNIIMLAPIGIYIGALVEKPLLKSVYIGFAVGFFIEFMQFILPIKRFPQLSDFLLNGISSVLGCLYTMFILWIKNKILTKKQAKQVEAIKGYSAERIETEKIEIKQPEEKEDKKIKTSK